MKLRRVDKFRDRRLRKGDKRAITFGTFESIPVMWNQITHAITKKYLDYIETIRELYCSSINLTNVIV